jgi:hypothetical protein
MPHAKPRCEILLQLDAQAPEAIAGKSAGLVGEPVRHRRQTARQMVCFAGARRDLDGHPDAE